MSAHKKPIFCKVRYYVLANKSKLQKVLIQPLEYDFTTGRDNARVLTLGVSPQNKPIILVIILYSLA